MPCPFPGMDPYLEVPSIWPGVHTSLVALIRQILAAQVSPRYFVDVERRIYLLAEDDPARQLFVADVVTYRAPSPAAAPGTGRARQGTPPHEVVLLADDEIEVREARLIVRRVGGERQVVTVVEGLSPANKTPGSRGREEYLAQRREVLRSPAHLVEIDLLRGGARAPSGPPWPAGDYVTVVSRAERRPRAEAYGISLRDPLPEIPVPLLGEDPDAVLDVGRAVHELYERARYDLELDYSRPPEPPLSSEDAAWAATIIAARPRG